MPNTRIVLFPLLCALTVAVNPAQDASGRKTFEQIQTEADSKRFNLLHDCDPMSLWISLKDDDSTVSGLTKERLRIVAESRLRGARLYSKYPRFSPVLFVSAIVHKSLFSVGVRFRKGLYDPHSEQVDSVTTWEKESSRLYRLDVENIVAVLSMHLDEFIVEYLRVNEEACGSN